MGDEMGYVYDLQQKVFAEYKGHLYEAVCLKRRAKTSGKQYFLKYDGFGAKNNRWQKEEELFPFTDANREIMEARRNEAHRLEQEKKEKARLAREAAKREKEEAREKERLEKRMKKEKAKLEQQQQKQLQQQQQQGEKQRTMSTDSFYGRSSTSTPTSPANATTSSSSTNAGPSPPTLGKARAKGRGRSSKTTANDRYGNHDSGNRRKRAHHTAAPHGGSEECVSSGAFIKSALLLPLCLTRNLVYQSNMCQDRKLVPLPRRPSLVNILDDYLNETSATKTPTELEAAKVFTQNMKVLFSLLLGHRLLYPLERYMYKLWCDRREKLKSDDEKLVYFSTIYGAEHFIRLLVLLPELLRLTTPRTSTLVLSSHVVFMQELIQHFAANHHRYVTGNYETMPPEYMRLSQFSGL